MPRKPTEHHRLLFVSFPPRSLRAADSHSLIHHNITINTDCHKHCTDKHNIVKIRANNLVRIRVKTPTDGGEAEFLTKFYCDYK